MLTNLVRQGTESFFATQRILLDLVMRQNANTMKAIRERLAQARSVPATALTEMAGEGMSNFIAAQRVLLGLAQRQNEIVMTGMKERATAVAPLAAMTDLVRRSVDTLLDMQQHFLTLAAKQTDAWIDAGKSGKAFEGEGLAEVARDAMETFVRSQKKFLDVIAEETANITEGATNGRATKAAKKTELSELARQSAEAFIDAQKKLLDVAAQQMDVNVKVARKAIDVMNPIRSVTLADLTRQTVDSFVTAQKALLEVVEKPPRTAGASEAAPLRRRPKGPAKSRVPRAHPPTMPVSA